MHPEKVRLCVLASLYTVDWEIFDIKIFLSVCGSVKN